MSATQEYPYATFLNVLFPPLQLVDVPSLVDACSDHWYNQTLIQVGDVLVRLGVMQGEFHWHTHQDQDEFFFVLEGHFIIDLEDARRAGPAAARGIRGAEAASCTARARPSAP